MPKILSFNLYKEKNGETPLGVIIDSFKSLDRFTKITVTTLFLIILSTPFIVTNLQIFNPKAQSPDTITVNSCGILDVPNVIYLLTQDVTNIVGTCFNITSDGVIFDGGGHTLTGDSIGYSDYGVVSSGKSNLVIKNLNVNHFGRGIYFASTSHSQIINVNASNNTSHGISFVMQSAYNEISNSTANDNEQWGIHLLESTHNTIANNTANSNETGIYLELNADFNSIINNITNNNTGDKGGIYLDVCSNNILNGNTASFNIGYGGIFAEDDSDGNQILNNTVNSNGYAGIYIEIGHENTLANNIVDSNPVYGIFLTINSKNNTLDSNAISNSPVGIYIEKSSHNRLLSNKISSSETGIYMVYSVSNTVSNGSIDSSRDNALSLYGGVDSAHNVFTNINIVNTAASGYDLFLENADINETLLVDMNLKSYSFADRGSNIIFKNTGKGEITFLQPISGTGTNLNNNIVIDNNLAFINSAQAGFNKASVITLNDIPLNMTNYRILRDGVLCPDSICSALVLSSGSARFSVTGAGRYTVAGDALPPSNTPVPPTLTPTPIPNPTVYITSPLNNARITRNKTTTITAVASDDVGVTKVEFSVNGVIKCVDTIAPYTCSWKVPAPKGRVYTLTAKAYDSSSNTGLSSTITVTAQ